MAASGAATAAGTGTTARRLSASVTSPPPSCHAPCRPAGAATPPKNRSPKKRR